MPSKTTPRTGKITNAEMVAMFGETMPVEAVSLLWDSPEEMTVGDMRAKLREIAAHDAAPASPPLDVEARALPPFKDAWAKKEAEGYLYGRDALENVALGYEMAEVELRALQQPRHSGGEGE